MVLLADALLEDRIGRVLLVDHLVVHVHHPLLQPSQVQAGSRGTIQPNGVLLVDRGHCHRVRIAVLGQT
jgi:hypothetical protein